MTFFMGMLQLFPCYFESNMFSLKLSHPLLTIWNSEKVSSFLQDSISFFNGLSYIYERMIWAHQRVYCWFIDNKIKWVTVIGHFPDIHHLVSHLKKTLLFLTCFHVLNNNRWNIVTNYSVIPILIEMLLDDAVTTSKVQNMTLFSFGKAFFNERLWWLRCLLSDGCRVKATQTAPLSSLSTYHPNR